MRGKQNDLEGNEKHFWRIHFYCVCHQRPNDLWQEPVNIYMRRSRLTSPIYPATERLSSKCHRRKTLAVPELSVRFITGKSFPTLSVSRNLRSIQPPEDGVRGGFHKYGASSFQTLSMDSPTPVRSSSFFFWTVPPRSLIASVQLVRSIGSPCGRRWGIKRLGAAAHAADGSGVRRAAACPDLNWLRWQRVPRRSRAERRSGVSLQKQPRPRHHLPVGLKVSAVGRRGRKSASQPLTTGCGCVCVWTGDRSVYEVEAKNSEPGSDIKERDLWWVVSRSVF